MSAAALRGGSLGILLPKQRGRASPTASVVITMSVPRDVLDQWDAACRTPAGEVPRWRVVQEGLALLRSY